MVKLSKLYTKGGDQGDTGLIGGKRVKKSHPQVEAYGNVDELNCWIGVVRSSLRSSKIAGFEDSLFDIQQNLFDLGAELSTPSDSDWKPPRVVSHEDVSSLEKEIDRWTEQVEELRSFLLPGASELTSYCHVARSVCRRAERSIIEFSVSTEIRAEVIQYMNRLSDWLFALARVVAKEIGEEETLWDPQRTEEKRD